MENNTSVYSVDTSLEVRSANSRSFIRPGIQENVKLDSVTYGTTPRGIEYLSFNFSDEHGDTVYRSEYPVRLRKPLDQMSDQEKEQ
jgi:hypothetical protein